MPFASLTKHKKWFAFMAAVVLALGVVLARRQLAPTPAEQHPSSPDRPLVREGQSAQQDQAFQHVKELLARRDISSALRELGAFEKLGKSSPELQLLYAECQRHYRDSRQLQFRLAQARTAGASDSEVALIESLNAIQAGLNTDQPRSQMQKLVEQGASQTDARSAVVLGCLNQQNWEAAQELLDNWEGKERSAESLYVRGMLFGARAQYELAKQAFDGAIDIDQRHELARMALADLLEFNLQSLLESLGHAQKLADDYEHNPTAAFRLARVLRKLGRIEASAQAFGDVSASTPWRELIHFELSELAFDAGQYAEAKSQLAQVGLQTPQHYRQMLDQAFAMMQGAQAASGEALFQRAHLGATVLAYAGNQRESEIVFAELLDRVGRLRRMIDLHNRMRTSGESPLVKAELARIASPDSSSSIANQTDDSRAAAEGTGSNGAALGMQIYADKCAQCHGAKGDGRGNAARHLFPRPRDFRSQRFRFVTSSNGLASDVDLANAIRHGLPGTSMPGYPELSTAQIDSLVHAVRTFQKQGLESRLRTAGRSDQEVQQALRSRIQFSDAVVVPALADSVELSVERGRQLFDQAGCQQCHPLGEDVDTNRPILSHFDESGNPLLARDLRRDPFKGGNSIAAIFARLALGIPGTPHPSVSVGGSEMLDVSYFVKSIAVKEPDSGTNYSRGSRVIQGVVTSSNAAVTASQAAATSEGDDFLRYELPSEK